MILFDERRKDADFQLQRQGNCSAETNHIFVSLNSDRISVFSNTSFKHGLRHFDKQGI